MLTQSQGQLELGTHPVNAGNQHWLLVALELKEPAEKAHAGEDLRAVGGAGMLGNQLLGPSGSLDIYPAGGIGLFNRLALLMVKIITLKLTRTQLHD
jgi:hypothetical protein